MMNNNQNIPKGYKDSPLGVIPQEWEVKRLGDLVDPNRKISYGIVQTGELISNGIPCIRVVDLVEGRIDKKQLITTSEEISHSYRKTIVKNGDIVIALRGKVGESVLITNDLSGCNLTRGVALISNYPNIFSRFLIQLINSPLMKVEFEKKMNGSALQEIPINVLRSIETVVPPLEEQRRIAEVLGCWDEAIERQGRMVELLTTRKRALMQQLLTPHRRLPNFFTIWETVELGELLSYEQPTPYIVKSTEYDDKYSTPVLTAGKTFILGYTNETIGVFRKLPVIIFDDFTTASKFVNFPFKAKSSAMKILSAKEGIDINFVYGAMQHLKYVVGGHERHWISKFAYLTISIPYLDEQRAIAEVLTTADREIELATQNLTALRSQKRALMQQLLTGKKRLK